LVSAAQSYADALSHGDRTALEAMSPPGFRRDRLDAVVDGYGRRPLHAITYDSHDPGGASVEFEVACAPQRKITMWQPFMYVDNGWRPAFGAPESQKAEPFPTASAPGSANDAPEPIC
jgi:hypothetical protein